MVTELTLPRMARRASPLRRGAGRTPSSSTWRCRIRTASRSSRACAAGRLVITAELLAKVPGRAHVPGTSYLRGHLLHLRRKLETNPAAPRHLLTEPGMGFRFRP